MTGRVVRGIDFDNLFASIDAMDTERFLSFFAEGATFRFGSAPAATGMAEIRAAVDGFFGSVAAVRHRLHKVIADDGGIACEGEVTYTRHDQREITLPFANVFEDEAGRFSQYRIYIDIAPLFAE
jgi:limonene-1,2-epoxide hydrolase